MVVLALLLDDLVLKQKCSCYRWELNIAVEHPVSMDTPYELELLGQLCSVSCVWFHFSQTSH